MIYYQGDKKYPSLPRGNKVDVYRAGGTGAGCKSLHFGALK